MKKKLELDDVDVVFDSTPLTQEEKRLISEFIRRDKEKVRNQTQRPTLAKKKRVVRAI